MVAEEGVFGCQSQETLLQTAVVAFSDLDYFLNFVLI